MRRYWLQWFGILLSLIWGAIWYLSFIAKQDCFDALSKSSANKAAIDQWQDTCALNAQRFEWISWGWIIVIVIIIAIIWQDKIHAFLGGKRY